MPTVNNPPIKACPKCYMFSYNKVKICEHCKYNFYENTKPEFDEFLSFHARRLVKSNKASSLIIDHAPEIK